MLFGQTPFVWVRVEGHPQAEPTLAIVNREKVDPFARVNSGRSYCDFLALTRWPMVLTTVFFTREIIDPHWLGLFNLVSRAFPFSLALPFGRDWHQWLARQEPITCSMQLPYLAYAKAFSQISLFLAQFGSTFRREIGSTIPYDRASIGRQ